MSYAHHLIQVIFVAKVVDRGRPRDCLSDKLSIFIAALVIVVVDLEVALVNLVAVVIDIPGKEYFNLGFFGKDLVLGQLEKSLRVIYTFYKDINLGKVFDFMNHDMN